MEPSSETEAALEEPAAPKAVVDKKGLSRLVSRLRKTLERPDQAELELDPDGFLPLSALGGKFRLDKMAAILMGAEAAMNHPTGAAQVYLRFQRAVDRANPKAFEWKSPTPDEAGNGAVTAVRLFGNGHSTVTAQSQHEPHLMFPGAVPHTLRVLIEKGPVKRADLFAAHFTRNVPILFIEPKSIVEYRGTPNNPVLGLLENARATRRFQLAVLSWAGKDVGPSTRLDKMQARASYVLDQLGLKSIPAFACSGHRCGLVGLADLAAEAMATTATVLNRGKDILDAVHGIGGVEMMETLLLPPPSRTELWIYASRSTRSTSSTASSASEMEGESRSESPDAAALFACKMWQSVHDYLRDPHAEAMATTTTVIVDFNSTAASDAVKATGVPVKALQAMLQPVAETPRSAYLALAAVVSARDPVTVATIVQHATEAAFTGTAAAFMISAILVSDAADYCEPIAHYSSVLLELVNEIPIEQTKLLAAVGTQAASEPAVMQGLLKILKKLYDLDVAAEEGAYFAWEAELRQQPAGAAVLAKVDPFLKWLREAEEEDSEDDDDDGQ